MERQSMTQTAHAVGPFAHRALSLHWTDVEGKEDGVGVVEVVVLGGGGGGGVGVVCVPERCGAAHPG